MSPDATVRNCPPRCLWSARGPEVSPFLGFGVLAKSHFLGWGFGYRQLPCQLATAKETFLEAGAHGALAGRPAGGGPGRRRCALPKPRAPRPGHACSVRRPSGAEDPDLTCSSPGRGRWACVTRSGPGALAERGFSPLPQKADTAVGGSSARPGSESLFPPAPFHVCCLTLRLFCGGGGRAWKGEIRSPGRGGPVLLPGQVRAGRWHSPNDAPSLCANGPPFTKRIKSSFPPGSA